MYRTTVKKTSGAASATAETVSRAATAASETVDVVFSSSSRGKKSFFKTIGEAIVNFFSSLKKALFLPFETVANFFNTRVKPVREEEQSTEQKSKSLIDEYIKEYERKKK
jgi:phage-related protein